MRERKRCCCWPRCTCHSHVISHSWVRKEQSRKWEREKKRLLDPILNIQGKERGLLFSLLWWIDLHSNRRRAKNDNDRRVREGERVDECPAIPLNRLLFFLFPCWMKKLTTTRKDAKEGEEDEEWHDSSFFLQFRLPACRSYPKEKRMSSFRLNNNGIRKKWCCCCSPLKKLWKWVIDRQRIRRTKKNDGWTTFLLEHCFRSFVTSSHHHTRERRRFLMVSGSAHRRGGN